MNEMNFLDYLKFVSDRIKEELPKGGTSLMISSDDKNAICCHFMGRPGDLFNVICACLEENDSLFELWQTAVKFVEFKKEEKMLRNKHVQDFLKSFASKTRKNSGNSASDEDSSVDFNLP